MLWQFRSMSATVTPVVGALGQTTRMEIRASAVLRAGQLALWLWVPLAHGLAGFSKVVLIGYVLAAAWTAVLFTITIRRNRISTGWILADVAVAVVCAVAVSRAFPPGQASTPHNWVVGPICGTAVLCAFFASRWVAAGSVAAITAAWLAGTWPATKTPESAGVFNNCAVIIVFAVVAALAAKILFRAAVQADEAALIALEAQRREAMAEARDEERRQQFKVLHDNVLHTLESIARGELDLHTAEVRAKCMRDADYLRGLITGGVDSIPTDLGVALAGMGRDRSALGLRINQQFDSLPKRIPANVTAALVGAAREALNNVVKHAHTAEAWLSAYGDGDGGVTVTIVDQGTGFDPNGKSNGLGLMRSVKHGVLEVGGGVRIDSAPGEGTSVELTWAP
jgi:signal transduction histidine kinase